mmetsp:Transcript_6581/g.28953  ORF Transcript_6581/g.28953 Transcript_6581/m.28953 type:complete len:233 (+) Transcript_6581:3026-3724(+)
MRSGSSSPSGAASGCSFGSMTTMDCFHFLACAIPACISHLFGSKMPSLSPVLPFGSSRSRTHRPHSHSMRLSRGRNTPRKLLQMTGTSGRSERGWAGSSGASLDPSPSSVPSALTSASVFSSFSSVSMASTASSSSSFSPSLAAIAAASACSGVVAGASRLMPGDSSMGDGTIIAAAIIASGNLGLSASSFTSDTIGLSEKTAEGRSPSSSSTAASASSNRTRFAGGESAPP